MFCDCAAFGILREVARGFGDRPAQQRRKQQGNGIRRSKFVRAYYFVHECWYIGLAACPIQDDTTATVKERSIFNRLVLTYSPFAQFHLRA